MNATEPATKRICTLRPQDFTVGAEFYGQTLRDRWNKAHWFGGRWRIVSKYRKDIFKHHEITFQQVL